MFGTIRKHQTWLWAIIITLTIISFVIFFSPYTHMDSRTGRGLGDRGSIVGKKVTDQEFLDAWKESALHQFIMTGHWPDEDRRAGFDHERAAYQWLLLSRKQQEMKIEISDDAAARMARQMVRAFERMGVSSAQVFLDEVLKPKGYSIDDFERFVRPGSHGQRIVSEAMVLAGEAAARVCLDRRVPALFRRQPPPEGSGAHASSPLTDLVAARAMRRTLRRGEASVHPGRHFALGLDAYVQVTSPCAATRT